MGDEEREAGMRRITSAVVLAVVLASVACANPIADVLGRAGIRPPNPDRAPPLPEPQQPVWTDSLYAAPHVAHGRLLGEISNWSSTKECFYASAHSIHVIAVPTGALCPPTIRVAAL
jgi:hypothetical protein